MDRRPCGDRPTPFRRTASAAPYFSAFLGVLLTFLIVPAGNSQPLFSGSQAFDVGDAPQAIVLADINADGREDAIVANSSSNTISVLRGDEQGTFGSRTDYSTGSGPRGVVSADLNGDGHLDLVVSSSGSSSVSVHMGTGGGAFAPKVDFPTGGVNQAVAVRDLNTDGLPDLVTANWATNAISVLLNQGGSLGSPTNIDVGFQPYSIAIGDVSSDQIPDIVAANYAGSTLTVLRGAGNGTFPTRSDYTTGLNPLSVVLGDLNGDSRLDVLTANSSSNTISVFLGRADGALGSRTDFLTGLGPSALALADLNKDGHLDVVAANASANTASVLRGNGAGSFGLKQDVPIGALPRGLALADLSGDTEVDLVATSYDTDTFSLLRGSGNGQFAVTPDVTVSPNPVALEIADVNHDGKQDLVVASQGAGAISTHFGNGNGTFSLGPTTGGIGRPTAMALGDLNGDGNADAVVVSDSYTSAWVLLGTPSGGFGGATPYPTPGPSVAVALADINGDGALDALVPYYSSASLFLLLGAGNGTLTHSGAFGVGVSPYAVATGDLNSDGRIDAVTANVNGSVSVLLSEPGGFAPSITYPVQGYPQHLLIRDLDADGRLDIIVAEQNGTVTALIGNGDGAFGIKPAHPSGPSPAGLAAGDWDSNGTLDVAVANQLSGVGTVSVLRGLADGTFEGGGKYLARSLPYSIRQRDLNGDGRPDLAVPNYSSNSISILLNSSMGGAVDAPPTVTAPASVPATEGVPFLFSVSAADPDGDPINSLTAAGLPAGAEFTPALGNGSAILSWTPSYSQAGAHSVSFTASNSLSGSAQTQILVGNVDRAPSVAAASQVGVFEANLLQVNVVASDPDAEPVASLTADLSGLPSGHGAQFTAGPGNGSGLLAWTPGYEHAGTYSVVFSASNALTGTAGTTVYVNETDRYPIVAAPASVQGIEGQPLSVAATASDPDGDQLVAFTAQDLPTGASFAVGPGYTSGTLHWTPTSNQAGVYAVRLSATSAFRPAPTSSVYQYHTGSAVVQLAIFEGSSPELITAPASVAGNENALIAFDVIAADTGGSPAVILSADLSRLPSGNNAAFAIDPTSGIGHFTWLPTYSHSGAYEVVFTDASGQSAPATTLISILDVDRPPIVTLPPSITSLEGNSLAVVISADDPDGDPILAMEASDLPPGAQLLQAPNLRSGTLQWRPSYSQAGLYNVTISASSPDRASPVSGAVRVGEASIAITVENRDFPPSIVVAGLVEVDEGAQLSLPVTATDVDGEAIEVLAADVSMLPMGNNAVFVASAGNTSGLLTWTPTFADSGSHIVLFTASNALSYTEQATIKVRDVDRAPNVTAPGQVTGAEGSPLSFEAQGRDPDGDPLVALTATPLPAGAVFAVGAGTERGTFHWTPDFSQAGAYAVVISAQSASRAVSVSGPVLTGSSAVDITVANTDRPPVITAPTQLVGFEGDSVYVSVSVDDPDGDTIVSLIADLSALPANNGATFSSNGARTSGTLAWRPSFDDAGTYSVHFAATNAMSGSAETSIEIQNVDRPPTVAPIPEQIVTEGTALNTPVTATDMDGGLITFELIAPPFAALGDGISQPGSASATIQLRPGSLDAGTYPGNRLIASADGLSGQATFGIVVINANGSPSISAPSSIFASEGSVIAFQVFASDPDGDATTLAIVNRPVGATFIDNGNGTGNFDWTPNYSAAGTYAVIFTARDSYGHVSPPKDVAIQVDNNNRGPVASAGGPYTAAINAAVQFDGSSSADPDGDPLTYAWDFGDGAQAVGIAPAHAFGTGGVFTVQLTVSDGAMSAADLTLARIQDEFEASAFLVGGNKTTRLGSGRSSTCLRVEPVDRSYQNASVDLSTLVMISPATGSVESIQAIVSKTAISSDRDHNGVEEITVCFDKADLRLLFDGLPGGRSNVSVRVETALTTGGRIAATMEMEIVSNGSSPAASISPNPLNPESVLTFRISRGGPVRVAVFDVRGNRVRTLVDGTSLEAGYHDLRMDGRTDAGAPLSSGVYFYRIEAPDGGSTGKFTVLK